MISDNARVRIEASSAWQTAFSSDDMRALQQQSRTIREMPQGKARRHALLDLLGTGFRICLSNSRGGGWHNQDPDILYLLKKGRVVRHKQYAPSAISEHKNHTYLGIATA